MGLQMILLAFLRFILVLPTFAEPSDRLIAYYRSRVAVTFLRMPAGMGTTGYFYRQNGLEADSAEAFGSPQQPASLLFGYLRV